jgi:hypothetical protein
MPSEEQAFRRSAGALNWKRARDLRLRELTLSTENLSRLDEVPTPALLEYGL